MPDETRSFYLYEVDGRLCVQHSIFDADLAELCSQYGTGVEVPLSGGRSMRVELMPARDDVQASYAVVTFRLTPQGGKHGAP